MLVQKLLQFAQPAEYAGYMESVDVNGLGYRDHSWGMRNDQLTLEHNWTFINLPGMGGHFMTIRNGWRPDNRVVEGYIAKPEGNEVAKSLTIEHVGDGPQGMPNSVIYRIKTIDGAPYTIVADVAGSFARLPLISQKPGEKVYHIVENMCPCRCEETGERGYANVEIGALKDPRDIA